MPEPVSTQEQARALLARVFGSTEQYRIVETRHGWGCQQVLTPEQHAEMGRGLGSYMINKRSGVITVHGSFPPEAIATEYDSAIEAGNPPPGFRVYPKQRRIQLTRTFEDATAIEYRIHQISLDDQRQPATTQQVRITKNPLRHQPTDRLSAEAATWAHAWAQETGTWPQEGTFQE